MDAANLARILLAGRMAPTGHNMQTWRFTVVTERENIAPAWLKAAHGSDGKDDIPDVLIIVSNDVRNRDGVQDSAAAMQNMLLQAGTYGYERRYMRGEDTIRNTTGSDAYRIFSLPGTHEIYGILGLGRRRTDSVNNTRIK